MVLEAENAYAAAHLEPSAELVDALVAEMRGRLKEDDASVPVADGPWLYYTRHREGGQQPLFCRKAGEHGVEEIMLDGDAERGDRVFFKIDEAKASPDHTKLAWSSDAAGSELHVIRVRDLATGIDADDLVTDTDGAVVWMGDGEGFYYVRVDENHRTCQVLRHLLGRMSDELVFAEDDPGWFVGLQRTVSGAFAVIRVSDHAANECHLLDLGDAAAKPACVQPRVKDLRYSLAHRGDELFIRTNADGAEDYKIVRAPLASPGLANWVDVVPHETGRMITGMTVYPDHLVRQERYDGLPGIVVRAFDNGQEYAIAFPEEAYSLSLEGRRTFATTILRFTFASMTTPRETFDFDLATGEKTWEHRTERYQHGSAAYFAGRDLVIWGSADHETLAFDAGTGTIAWRFPTGRSVKYAPAVDEVLGLVAFASFDRFIYLLDAATGRELGRWETGGLCYTTPLLAHGKLFCGLGRPQAPRDRRRDADADQDDRRGCPRL